MAKKSHAELAADFKKYIEDQGLIAYVERQKGQNGFTQNYLFIGKKDAPANVNLWKLRQMVEAYLLGHQIVKQPRYVEEIAKMYSKLVEHRDVEAK
jgi:hypothetical protein